MGFWESTIQFSKAKTLLRSIVKARKYFAKAEAVIAQQTVNE